MVEKCPAKTLLDLHAVLERQILPRLSIKDMTSLACSCAALRAALASASPELWKTAAAQQLPPQHPALLSADVAILITGLKAYAQSQRSIRSGSFTEQELQPGLVSPDGQTIIKMRWNRQTSSGSLQLTRLKYEAASGGVAVTTHTQAIKPGVDLRNCSQYVRWLNNGQVLLCGQASAGTIPLHMCEIAAGQLTSVSGVPGRRMPWCSSDISGRYLAVVVPSRMFIMDLHNNGRVLDSFDGSPCFKWHPSIPGCLALIERQRPAPVKIYYLPDTRSPRILAEPADALMVNGWSPDGRFLNIELPWFPESPPYEHPPPSCQIIDVATGRSLLSLAHRGQQSIFSCDSLR